MKIRTTPEQHLAMMRSIEAVLRHFAVEDNMTMYKEVIAIREYVQELADDYAMMRVVIDRMAVNQLAAHDNR
jgi:hypothetical protein